VNQGTVREARADAGGAAELLPHYRGGLPVCGPQVLKAQLGPGRPADQQQTHDHQE
jgi:hypothetical protein